MATPDIFDFWAECPADARVHPQDAPVFARPFLADKTMGFDLRCLPASFAGPLRTAPVVLLYLSPGLDEGWDVAEASTAIGQARYAAQRTGSQPLPSAAEAKPHFDWWSSRTKVFGEPEAVRQKVAILNLGAYHSAMFSGQLGLAALPSSRVTLDWAHETLFPAATEGRRVVVCMRSAAAWGLETGKRYGSALFAPSTVRGGHMRKKEEGESAYRQIVIDAVCNAIKAG